MCNSVVPHLKINALTCRDDGVASRGLLGVQPHDSEYLPVVQKATLVVGSQLVVDGVLRHVGVVELVSDHGPKATTRRGGYPSASTKDGRRTDVPGAADG